MAICRATQAIQKADQDVPMTESKGMVFTEIAKQVQRIANEVVTAAFEDVPELGIQIVYFIRNLDASAEDLSVAAFAIFFSLLHLLKTTWTARRLHLAANKQRAVEGMQEALLERRSAQDVRDAASSA